MVLLVENRYAFQDVPVGGGAHSQLFRGTDTDTQDAVALKLFQPPRWDQDRILTASWTNELSTYQRLSEDQNLAKLVDFGRMPESNAPYLIFEWMDGDLFEAIRSGDILTWTDLFPIAQSVLMGLSRLHEEGFVHRDVKPENILKSQHGVFKLADFGTTRLVETVSLGLTMNLLGTVPYAPPERGTPSPTAAYDVYSFGATLTTAIANPAVLPRDASELLQLLNTARDRIPKSVIDVISTSLSTDPQLRQLNAGVLLAQLQRADRATNLKREASNEVYVSLTHKAIDMVRSEFGIDEDNAKNLIANDFNGVALLSYNSRHKSDENTLPDLRIAGETLILSAKRDTSRPSRLVVVAARRPLPHQIELARSEWLSLPITIRQTNPTDERYATATLDKITERVLENDHFQATKLSERAENSEFTLWSKVLKAKFEAEDQKGRAVPYTSIDASAGRAKFTVASAEGLVIGESRMVRSGRRIVLAGEVEAIENSEVILWITRGLGNGAPSRGNLEVDVEASKSKLRKEQAALDRLRSGKSVRPELKGLLLDPSTGRAAKEVSVDVFHQTFLDPIKQEAVRLAMGSEDFLVVKGPPGTGKTTLIAEIVAQTVDSNPSSRILLASQTHIALDNALARVEQLSPEATLVRLGREEKIAAGVERLTLEGRINTLRSQIVAGTKDFVKEFARRLGIILTDLDLPSLVHESGLRDDRLKNLRSRIALKKQERSALVSDIEFRRQKIPDLIAIAEKLEVAAGSGTAGVDLDAAVKVFIEAGLSAAADLEASTSLGSKILTLELSLDDLAIELRDAAALLRESVARLAVAMDRPTETPLEALKREVDSRPGNDDPRLRKIQTIAEEWESRFGKSREFNAVAIASSNVIAATCVGMPRAAEAMDFDLCILDEASKATSTEALVPFVSSRKWILVGDSNQLPPFLDNSITSPEAIARHGLRKEDFAETLFDLLSERLPVSSVITLTHQHRMHPSIGGLVSECFYGGSLTSEPRAVAPSVKEAFETPVRWIDTSHRDDRRETRDGKSFRNRAEAHVVRSALDRLNWLAARNEEELSVAVLTPYEGQRSEVVSVLANGDGVRENLQVHVANIDAYQGQEADIVIVTLTRSNGRRDLGFLSNPNRLNVALSRARDGLVVIGDRSFFAESGNESFEKLIRHMATSEGCSSERADFDER